MLPISADFLVGQAMNNMNYQRGLNVLSGVGAEKTSQGRQGDDDKVIEQLFCWSRNQKFSLETL